MTKTVCISIAELEAMKSRLYLFEQQEVLRNTKNLERLIENSQTSILIPGVTLAPQTENVLLCLCKKDVTPHIKLYDHLYRDRSGPRRNPSVLKVLVSLTRTALKPVGIEIKNIRGKGYEMSELHRNIIIAHTHYYGQEK
jgi:DNA-binding winged helix-turn-helix (wHTH) protein